MISCVAAVTVASTSDMPDVCNITFAQNHNKYFTFSLKKGIVSQEKTFATMYDQ